MSNKKIVDHPEFKWMPGMLAYDEAEQPHRVLSVEFGDLIQTDRNGGSPSAIGLVAIDPEDPATIGCLTHIGWSAARIRRIQAGTDHANKGGE